MNTMHLYDTWTHSERKFDPIRTGEVSLYTCGPTVYDYAHVGNLRTYIFEDGLVRVLKMNGYRVRRVMNITDVGHLTSDADEGEDKIEKGSRRTGESAWDVAARYTEAFKVDLERLNVLAPDIWCKATDHIDDQIRFIQEIERNGYTYRTPDGIYFDTSLQPSYGQLARSNLSGLQGGHRVTLGYKRNESDYALWKFSASHEKRQMEWNSPWGRGFPGWHIECSAMAHRHLGEYFDIHCGGEDHIAVHHTNEISQTEAAYGTRLSNFWMHARFMLFNDAKMAKSAGEFLRLQTLIDKGHDPLAFRYLCLMSHYRSQLAFSWEALEAAGVGLNRLRRAVRDMGEPAQPDQAFEDRFVERINRDLNYPHALALVNDLLKAKLSDGVKKATLLKFDEALGLGLAVWEPGSVEIPTKVRDLADARQAARAQGLWNEADKLREQLRQEGWLIKETNEGYRLSPVASMLVS